MRQRLRMEDAEEVEEQAQSPPAQPPPLPPKQRRVHATAFQPLPPGVSIQAPPQIARKKFGQPPQSNLEFDQQCTKAQQYQEARQAARELYMDHARSSCPQNIDASAWQAHHAGFFDALNPHPGSIYDSNIMPQRREYPASPEELFYLRDIEQFRLEARPSTVKTTKEVIKDAKKRYKK